MRYLRAEVEDELGERQTGTRIALNLWQQWIETKWRVSVQLSKSETIHIQRLRLEMDKSKVELH